MIEHLYCTRIGVLAQYGQGDIARQHLTGEEYQHAEYKESDEGEDEAPGDKVNDLRSP